MTASIVTVILAWFGCVLVVLGCAVDVGLELAYQSPSYGWLAFLAVLAVLATYTALWFTTVVDARAREHGASTLPIMVLLSLACLALLSPGCAWLKGESKATAKNVVDCTAQQAMKLTTELSPTFEQLLSRATGGDGRVDWPSIDDATRNLSEIGWCALEHTVARLIGQATSAGAPQSSPQQMAPSEAEGLAAIRRKKFGDTTFKVK